MPIQRYLSRTNLERMKKDFQFLIESVGKSHGEIDLSLRNGYFNLYYRGNSLAKVTFQQKGMYKVCIHEKFFEGSHSKGYLKKHNIQCNNAEYCAFALPPSQLHPFFQAKHLDDLKRRIKTVNYCEETTFEQMVVTDNLNQSEIIIIDRQVTDPHLQGKRMDLLALKLVAGKRYRFHVIEVKLGNNPELSEDVASQLAGYISHMQQHFDEYKECYEENYRQVWELGLLDHQVFPFDSVEIVEPIEGVVLVLGYSGLAQAQLDHLQQNYPNLQVIHHNFRL